MRLPETVRNNAAPGAGFLAGVFWLMEQYAAQTSWWSVIPFGMISLMAFSFWAGQDLYHPNGRIRKQYQKLRYFGEFQSFKTEHECVSLQGIEQQCIAIYVPFVFSKERLLDTASIKATITGYIANRLTVANRITMQNSYHHEWKDAGLIATRYVTGSKIQIPIAFIPREHGIPGVYGDKKLSGSYFSEGTAHFIEITLLSGKQRQRHTVQIFMPINTLCNDLIFGINSGRFLIFENEKLPTPDSIAST